MTTCRKKQHCRCIRNVRPEPGWVMRIVTPFLGTGLTVSAGHGPSGILGAICCAVHRTKWAQKAHVLQSVSRMYLQTVPNLAKYTEPCVWLKRHRDTKQSSGQS